MKPGQTLPTAFALALALALGLGSAGACDSTVPDLTVTRFEAGAEASAAVDASEAGPSTDPTLGGPCTDTAQCDDGIACTFDRCDPAIGRCRNAPDDSLCADAIYCNGRERCVPRLGCRPGEPVTCADGSSCTVNRCVEESKACESKPRDIDGDGEADDHCTGGTDCDDLDPSLGSKRVEICGNGKDDNCNRRIDELPCSSPQNDTCQTALSVTAPGLFSLSTAAAKRDFNPTCSVEIPGASRDVVVAVTVPGSAGDPPRDLEVWASSPSGDTAVAIQTQCGVTASELACGHTKLSPVARARARSVRPGVYHVVVTTQGETSIELSVELSPGTPLPSNEGCASPQPIALEVPFVAQIVDASKDLASECASETGELTYALTLTEPRDVRIHASVLRGSGEPVVSFRDPTCAAERGCRKGSLPPLLARNLPAGTHVLTVAGTAALDASVVVRASPPTSPPANGTCASPPPAPVNGAIAIDLSGQDEIKNGCLPGGPSAAYDLTLTQPSDVMIVGRFPSNELGAVSLNGVGCTKADVLLCAKDTTPVRISRRALPAGTYRVVVADERGQNASLTVLVRPTVPATQVTGAAGCPNAATIPVEGGFFTGDTQTANPNFSAGCDTPGGPPNGAGDQILKLALPSPRRVVLNMDGSVYATILDLRQGATCPGIEVPNACYVGFRGPRSFLDLSLQTGTYWVQVDGLSGAAGPWNLDVRVLPP